MVKIFFNHTQNTDSMRVAIPIFHSPIGERAETSADTPIHQRNPW